MENIVAESFSSVDNSSTASDTLRERIKGIEKDVEWIKRLLFVMLAGMLAILVMIYELRGAVDAIQASLLG